MSYSLRNKKWDEPAIYVVPCTKNTVLQLGVYLVGHNERWNIQLVLILIVCFWNHDIFFDVFLVLWCDLENKEIENQ